MHFAGEPEIAVLRQETFASSSDRATYEICGAPVMCADRLWSIVGRTSGVKGHTEYALAIEATAAATVTESAERFFDDVISFPAASFSTYSSASKKQPKFTTVPRKSQSVLSGEPKNLVISVRHLDGLFVIADADTGRAVGTGSLQLEHPPGDEDADYDGGNNNNNDNNNNSGSDGGGGISFADTSPKKQQKSKGFGECVQTVMSDDQTQNTVVIFATTHSKSSSSSNGTDDENLSILQLVVASDPNTNSPQLHVVLCAVIPQRISVAAACGATDQCVALALNGDAGGSGSGASVELWARAVLFEKEDQKEQPQKQQQQQLVHGRCTYDAAKAGTVVYLCRDEVMERSRLFGATDRGSCVIFAIGHSHKDNSSEAKKRKNDTNSSSSSNNNPAAGNIRVLRIISVTDAALTSAVCACSTVWFADSNGSVRIWSLDTLEEMGTLDSTVQRAGEDNNGGDKDKQSNSNSTGPAIILSMSDLEFRHNIGVFRGTALQSLAVKQAVAPAVLPTLPSAEQQPSQAAAAASPPSTSAVTIAVDTTTRSPSQTSKASTATASAAAAAASPPAKKLPPAQQQQEFVGPQTNAAALSFIRQLCDVLSRPASAIAASASSNETRAGTSNSPSPQKSAGAARGSKRGDVAVTAAHGSQRVAVPERVVKAVPEAEYLEAALLSVAQSSGTIARCLPQLGLKPSTLTQDVSSVCDIAVRMYRRDAMLRQVVESLEEEAKKALPPATEEKEDQAASYKPSTAPAAADGNAGKVAEGAASKAGHDDDEHAKAAAAADASLSTSDRLINICRQLTVKHENEVARLKARVEELELKRKRDIEALENKRGKEITELRTKLARLETQQQLQRSKGDSPVKHVDPKKAEAGTAAASAPPPSGQLAAAAAVAAVEEETVLDAKELKQRADKLAVELRSKATLVKHLMQLTNDNGRVIEEMRASNMQRRDECVDLRRVLRELDTHHSAMMESTAIEIDKMLATFSNPNSTATSNLRSVVFMLQNLRQKLRIKTPQ